MAFDAWASIFPRDFYASCRFPLGDRALVLAWARASPRPCLYLSPKRIVLLTFRFRFFAFLFFKSAPFTYGVRFVCPFLHEGPPQKKHLTSDLRVLRAAFKNLHRRRGTLRSDTWLMWLAEKLIPRSYHLLSVFPPRFSARHHLLGRGPGEPGAAARGHRGAGRGRAVRRELLPADVPWRLAASFFWGGLSG